LLEKYGFKNPLSTWSQLTRMAQTIQDGERKAGDKDFYGFSGGRLARDRLKPLFRIGHRTKIRQKL
jgi:ABC-type glycerol-3-phosphate transport system substrate-binding protein